MVTNYIPVSYVLLDKNLIILDVSKKISVHYPIEMRYEKMSARRENGFGTLLSKGEGKPWLARWVYKGQVHYKSTGETDKKKAYKVLERLTRPYREEREVDVLRALENRITSLEETRTREKLESGELWTAFEETLKNSDVKDSTKSLYKSQIETLASWMKKKVKFAEDINAELCAEFLEQLNACPMSWNLQLSLFKRVWKELGSKFNLKAGIWDGFTKKRVSKKSARRALTNEEVQKLLMKAETDDMRILIMIGLYTGLRISDCSCMKWESVDFENAMLHVVPIKTEKFNDEPIDIPMHPALMKALKKIERKGEFVSEENAKTWMKNRKMSAKVVKLMKSCGITTSVEDEKGRQRSKASFHSFRHTFISMAINSGMSPMLVQKIVGHSSLKMTDTYFHESMDKMKEGIENMPDVM